MAKFRIYFNGCSIDIDASSVLRNYESGLIVFVNDAAETVAEFQAANIEGFARLEAVI